jgi:tRNA dimethylallyltransferase
VIAGPTAVGKTSLSIELAKKFNSAIVSSDSRQFYKEMNIGTAKPNAGQLESVPHYLIGTKSVDELYGAGHFAREARELIIQLFDTMDIVFLVGGSGLYIDALLQGVDEFEDVPVEIREKLNVEYTEKGIAWIRERLRTKDPEYFEKVDVHNPQRMIRALEVIEFTGKPFSGFLRQKEEKKEFNAIKILINTDRQRLYEQIEKRVDQMMDDGLLEEVKTLLEKKKFNALKTVGYKELFLFLEGEVDLKHAVQKIKQHTRNYAKRQLTWFRNKGYSEFSPDEPEKIEKFIREQIKNGPGILIHK